MLANRVLHPPTRRLVVLAMLLFVTGGCALVYQTAWMRQLTLVFGATTGANAAVLAIFMGGLGAGAALLGKRVDAYPRPLVFYGALEAVIAVTVPLTPLLVDLVRALYIATGGTQALGAMTTPLRLLFAALVLAIPTLAMGGTLPAATRAAALPDDERGVTLAVLYAANAIGAVAGTLIATFFAFEALGIRATLWIACALNALVAALAIYLGRAAGDEPEVKKAAPKAVAKKQPAAAIPAASGPPSKRGKRKGKRTGAKQRAAKRDSAGGTSEESKAGRDSRNNAKLAKETQDGSDSRGLVKDAEDAEDERDPRDNAKVAKKAQDGESDIATPSESAESGAASEGEARRRRATRGRRRGARAGVGVCGGVRERVRVLPDGAGVVPDAVAVARRIDVHVRPHPGRGAARDRARRAGVSLAGGAAPADGGRVCGGVWCRGGLDVAAARDRRRPRDLRDQPARVVELRLRRAGGRVGRDRRDRRLPGGVRRRHPVPAARRARDDRTLARDRDRHRHARRARLRGEHGGRDRRRARRRLRPDVAARRRRRVAARGARARRHRPGRARAACDESRLEPPHDHRGRTGGARRDPRTVRRPSPVWRHSPIGAGRAQAALGSPLSVRRWRNFKKRQVVWERDGIESSIALIVDGAYAFFVNGKSDGNAIDDAGTQVMLGLLGPLFHPAPKKALVVGLGTGSTAGWLAAVPSIERVDVVEIEPAVLDVAAACGPVNRNVMQDPRVVVRIGDAREVVQSSSERYDIIVSEPSNPFRAGVANLFSREFYASVRPRLTPDGILVQWLQTYEVDARTIASVYATLHSELPHIHTWNTGGGDIVLLASASPIPIQIAELRARIATPAYAAPLQRLWHAENLEGLFARFVGDDRLASALAGGAPLNTDDRPLVEYGYARTAGAKDLFSTGELFEVAKKARAIPQEIAALDWRRLLAIRRRDAIENVDLPQVSAAPDPITALGAVAEAWNKNDVKAAAVRYAAQSFEPVDRYEQLLVATLEAYAGDLQGLGRIDAIQPTYPTEAAALRAVLAAKLGDHANAARHLAAATRLLRDDPWVPAPVMAQLLATAISIAKADRALGRAAFDALAEPWAVRIHESERQSARLTISEQIDVPGTCVAALDPVEPYPPWGEHILEYRVRCYRETQHPRLGRAEADLAEFRRLAPPRLSDLVK